jgi:hypothetical protein
MLTAAVLLLGLLLALYKRWQEVANDLIFTLTAAVLLLGLLLALYKRWQQVPMTLSSRSPPLSCYST